MMYQAEGLAAVCMAIEASGYSVLLLRSLCLVQCLSCDQKKSTEKMHG